MFKQVLIFVVALVTVPCYSSAASNQDIKVCTGSAFGDTWNREIDGFVKEIFSGIGKETLIIRGPNKRAEFLFKNGACEAFFAGDASFHKSLGIKDVLRIEPSVLTVFVELLSFRKPSKVGSVNILKELNQKSLVGYYGSYSLSQYLTKLTPAKLVELLSIEQGTELLKNRRIDFFVYPSILQKRGTTKNINPEGLFRHAPIAEVKLFLWIDKSLVPQSEAINGNIRRLYTEGRFPF